MIDEPAIAGDEPERGHADQQRRLVGVVAAVLIALAVAAALAITGAVRLVAKPLVHAALPVELIAALLFVGPFLAIAAMWLDYRRSQELRHSLTELAGLDTLTGLPNRLNLIDRIAAAVAETRGRNTGVAVLFVDLDRFKIVNDTFGHEVGDALMVAVAGRLREALRPGDQVVRYGGDEFVAVCSDISNAGAAERVARRVISVLSEPYTIGRQNLNISTCVGIALTDFHGGSAEDVLRDADVAMYQAKAAGAGSYRSFDRTLGKTLTPSAIESRLREAVERQEFRVFYQPVVRTHDGVIVGVEALLRWDDPERGLLAPDEFLPILEETNLIIPVGTWVLREACRQAALWRDDFPDHELQLTVNVSARQLSQVDFGEIIAQALADTDLPHSSVCLEITESALMDDVSSAWSVLREAKTTGVKLALDDFGTGFSSLSYIRRFSLDMLKIDKSFVDGVGSEPDDNAIVEHVVGMARALGMVTVAEGVEHPAQLRELQRLGCDRSQGYWFSPPVPPNAIEALLNDASLPERWSDVHLPEPVTPAAPAEPAARPLARPMILETAGFDISVADRPVELPESPPAPLPASNRPVPSSQVAPPLEPDSVVAAIAATPGERVPAEPVEAGAPVEPGASADATGPVTAEPLPAPSSTAPAFEAPIVVSIEPRDPVDVGSAAESTTPQPPLDDRRPVGVSDTPPQAAGPPPLAADPAPGSAISHTTDASVEAATLIKPPPALAVPPAPPRIPTGSQASGARWAGRGRAGNATPRLPIVTVPPSPAAATAPPPDAAAASADRSPITSSPSAAAPAPASRTTSSPDLVRPLPGTPTAPTGRGVVPPPPRAPRRSTSAADERPLVLPHTLPFMREVGSLSEPDAPS